jgi:hypothetical protein
MMLIGNQKLVLAVLKILYLKKKEKYEANFYLTRHSG